MIKVLMTLPVKIGFDGMSKQVLSYGKYMDKSDVIIDLVSCRGFDPKMKSNVDEANFHNIYRLEYRDTNQIKYFLDLYKIMKKEKYDVMKRIFYLRTYYQVIVALQMVNTICIDDQVVFLISDDSESTEMLVESLGKLGIVYKSILVKTKKLTYQKSMIDKIKDFVEVCFLKKNRYVIFLKEVLNEKFDEFIFFNYGVDTVAFYNLMVRNNINLAQTENIGQTIGY